MKILDLKKTVQIFISTFCKKDRNRTSTEPAIRHD